MAKPGRISSVDLLRGVVMVLMAIDHVRVYAGVPAGGPTPGVFLTRWVTHFCAPAFVFFAGTSAFLYGRTLSDRAGLSQLLLIRGLWLVFLELTVIRYSWMFNFGYSVFVLAGVIWMIGWCMVLMAALVRLPIRVVGMLGLGIMAAQQTFSVVPAVFSGSIRDSLGWWWEFVYPAGFGDDGPVEVLYTIVPWIGVMATGYAFGSILAGDAERRRRFCLRVGLSMTALFIIGAVVTVLTAPASTPWLARVFRALSPSKYPASPMFLLMTLGPTIALVPWAEQARGQVVEFFSLFGKVPMFYYLLHIPVIHALALLVNMARTGAPHHEWYGLAPYASVPPEARWSLPLLYVIFGAAIALLYPLCRWYAGYKATHRSLWLRLI